MHLTCVVGARPNFMKIAPILEAARASANITPVLVHTGQHYDEKMSQLFFNDLGMPAPDCYMGIGSGSHAVQTAKVMIAFDELLDQQPTDVVLVVGDVNSTLACALVAVKRNIIVCHVEAGLRSGDRAMPEEINRILTDQVSDYLFTTERQALEHLEKEGVPESRVHFVGNVMIDTLFKHRERAKERTILNDLGAISKGYALVTLHRPSNVDTLESAQNTMAALQEVVNRHPVILPMHPRTKGKLQQFGLLDTVTGWKNVTVLEPQGYLDFLALMDNAQVVVTDSGGVQEETTALGVPCLTFRDNTERPITVTNGTNQLIGLSATRLATALDDLLSGKTQVSDRRPELWDGKAAPRIIEILERLFV